MLILITTFQNLVIFLRPRKDVFSTLSPIYDQEKTSFGCYGLLGSKRAIPSTTRIGKKILRSGSTAHSGSNCLIGDNSSD